MLSFPTEPTRFLIEKQCRNVFPTKTTGIWLDQCHAKVISGQSIMTSMYLLVQMPMARQKFVGFKGHVWMYVDSSSVVPRLFLFLALKKIKKKPNASE